MTAVVKHLSSNGGFQNQAEELRVMYDFANDGGATGVLDLFTAQSDLILESMYAIVHTAVTSSGSLVLDVGVTGDDDLLMDAVAKAALSINSIHKPLPVGAITLTEGTPNTQLTNVITLPLPVRIPSGEKVFQTIVTAAATAGKIEYVFRVRRQ